MNPDLDLDTWRSLWQAGSDGPAAADLRDRVARETRRRTVALIAPVLVTVGIGGWTAGRAILAPDIEHVVLAVETWLFIGLIWAGSLWIDRGTWRPLGDTTAAFVEISIRRCRSTLNGLRFGAVMYAAQFLFLLLWRRHYLSLDWPTVLTSWPVILLGWVGGPILWWGAVWYRRRKAAELEQLIDLRRQLSGD
jgi:hypothetical protein